MDVSDILVYLLYLVTGVVAGAINTVSGGATVFIFALLLFNGISSNVANGTNRFGVLLQNLTGAWTFQRSGLLDFEAVIKYGIPAVLGALLGSLMAVDLPDWLMEYIVAGVMALSLPTLFWQPKSSFFPSSNPTNRQKLISFAVFFGIGFYGGFIQVGAGLVVISVLTGLAGLSIIRANAVKMAIIFLYTIPAIIIFALKGSVDWGIAATLAIGQVIGTRWAGRVLIKYPQAETVAKWLIVVMILFSLFKTFGGLDSLLA